MTDVDSESVPYFAYLGLECRPDGTNVLPGDRRHAGDVEGTFLHGGVVAAFLEATALLHFQSSGTKARIIDFTTSFLRPGALTDTFATAQVLFQGRRFSTISVTAWQNDAAKPVAVGQGTFRLDIV